MCQMCLVSSKAAGQIARESGARAEENQIGENGHFTHKLVLAKPEVKPQGVGRVGHKSYHFYDDDTHTCRQRGRADYAIGAHRSRNTHRAQGHCNPCSIRNTNIAIGSIQTPSGRVLARLLPYVKMQAFRQIPDRASTGIHPTPDDLLSAWQKFRIPLGLHSTYAYIRERAAFKCQFPEGKLKINCC